MIDIGEVAALFAIHKAAHEHGEAFKNIRAAAYEALKKIDQEHADQVSTPAGGPAAPQSGEDELGEDVAAEDEAPAEENHQRRV